VTLFGPGPLARGRKAALSLRPTPDTMRHKSNFLAGPHLVTSEQTAHLFRSRRAIETGSQDPGTIPRAAQDSKEETGRTMGSTLDIYCSFFGLSERPFSLLPDPSFLYWSPQHRRAYTMLEYGLLTHAPITLITGEVGAGKTTLLHHLLKTIDEDVKIGLVSNAQGSRGELLRWVLMALDVPASAEETYVDLFARFQAFLIEEYAKGRRVILIFDEAQNLSRESLEELRMFTNINANKDELLQLILVGQPELNTLVRRPDMTQFAQRISSNYHLPAMDAATVRGYIDHRLKVVGARQNIFSNDATLLIHEATRGVPRLVNQLCDLAMLYAFTADRKRIHRALVQQVLTDGVFFAGGLLPGEAPA
jgi:type II secretory pathway predicted ATPase ExeA